MIRSVQAEGGFATVLQKGEADSGTILVVTRAPGETSRLFERMPHPEKGRAWDCVRIQDPDKPEEFSDYLARRGNSDPDCWLVELEIARAERFIA